MLRYIAVVTFLLLSHITLASAGNREANLVDTLIQSGKLVPDIILYKPDASCQEDYPECINHQEIFYRKDRSASPISAVPLSLKPGKWFVVVAFRNNDVRDYYCYIVVKKGSDTNVLNMQDQYKTPAGKLSDPLAGFVVETPVDGIDCYVSDKPVDPCQFNSGVNCRGSVVIIPSIVLIPGK